MMIPSLNMAMTLKELGFVVIHKENADQITMKRVIRQFGRKLREGGIGLFYYAGHGVQVKGRNYLIPIGAHIETESEVEYEAVDAGRVLGQMDSRAAIHSLTVRADKRNRNGAPSTSWSVKDCRDAGKLALTRGRSSAGTRGGSYHAGVCRSPNHAIKATTIATAAAAAADRRTHRRRFTGCATEVIGVLRSYARRV